MMKQEQRPSWLSSVSIAALCSWGAVHTWSLLETDMALVPGLLSFVSVTAWGKALKVTVFHLKNRHKRRKAKADSTNHGSARWATKKDIKKSGLLKQTKGILLGISEFGDALFDDSESHCLVVSPAGGGKTVSFVVPNLMHYYGSVIYTDLKGTITCIILKFCEAVQKCRVVKLNPAGMFPKILGQSDCYNPLIILLDAWEQDRHADIVMDARSMTMQLIPKPDRVSENEYFRRGSVKTLVFILVYLSTRDQPKDAHLCEALRLLRNQDDMVDALHMANCSDILSGELADMANNLLDKVKMKDSQQFRSFVEGAEQAIEFASSSSHIAKIIKHCTFRFFETKTQRMKIGIIADPSRMDALEPWVGLMIWCALMEIKRCNNSERVIFMLDESTNFRVQGISEALTALREYGVKVIFIMQELQEYARIYGNLALETMLSQTLVKLFIGVTGYSAEWLSRQLGNTTMKTESYNLGTEKYDPVQSSLNEHARPLQSSDEIRGADYGIAVIEKEFPIKFDWYGYHEIMPLKKKAGINPMHGKPFKGKTKLTIRY